MGSCHLPLREITSPSPQPVQVASSPQLTGGEIEVLRGHRNDPRFELRHGAVGTRPGPESGCEATELSASHERLFQNWSCLHVCGRLRVKGLAERGRRPQTAACTGPAGTQGLGRLPGRLGRARHSDTTASPSEGRHGPSVTEAQASSSTAVTAVG